MKTFVRNTLLAAATLMMAATSTAIASDYDYKGKGFWRTFDHNGNILHDASGDKGPRYTVDSIQECKDKCDGDHQCKGVEFNPDGHGAYHCEVHHDEYADCKSDGAAHNPHDTGCHVKKHHSPPPKHQPTTDYGKHECYSKHWNWVKLVSYVNSEVSVDPHDHYKLKAYPTGHIKFDLIRHYDCTVSFRSHENYKYVSTTGSNNYYLKADGYYIGEEDRYKVYKHDDGSYSFKPMQHDKWVYSDHSGYVKAGHFNQHDHNWDARKYRVNANF